MELAVMLVSALSGLFGGYYWRKHQSSSFLPEQNSAIETERRYREIVENSSDAVFIVKVLPRAQFCFESLNPAAQQLICTTGTEYCGWRFDEIIAHAADAALACFVEELAGKLCAAIENGLPLEYESGFSGGEGRTFYLKLIPMAEDGGITHIIAFAQDISARKLYELELLEHARLERLLSGFAASAPGFLYSYRHDSAGNNAMPFASHGIADIFGLQPEDVATSIVRMSMLIHTDDMERFIGAFAGSARDLSDLRVEFRVHHPHRGERWVESRAVPIVEPDGSIMWHGFMHDISERKRTESDLLRSRERLAEAQRIGQMGSWELDLVANELTWSEEIFRIFELDPQNFLPSYQAFLEVIHPDDRENVDQAYKDSLENGTPYSIDHRLRFADGRVKYVRECCESRYDAQGKPLYSRGTVQDVTLLKESELRLGETQSKLRQLVLSREALLEGERTRVAWEMHEELGQQLAAMKMRMFGMHTRLPQECVSLSEDSNAIVDLIDTSIKSVRGIVAGLRPPVLMLGLAAALEWLVADFRVGRHETLCELEIGTIDDEPSDELTTLVFRIAQESLNNIAQQTCVQNVSLCWESRATDYCLTIIRDCDGKRCELAQDKLLSFFGMQERVLAYGGTMRVFDTVEHRTVIEAIFPRVPR